jgi:hypothetical protein
MDQSYTEENFALYKATSYGTKIKGEFSWITDNKFIFRPFIDEIDLHEEYFIVIPKGTLDTEKNPVVRGYFASFFFLTNLQVPHLTNLFPLSGSTNFPVESSVTLFFDLPMDESSTISAFSISPSVNGTTSIESNLLIFKPDKSFENGKYYNIKLEKSAKSYQNVKAKDSYSISFIAGQYFIAPSIMNVYTNSSTNNPPMTNGQQLIDKDLPSLCVLFSIPMKKDEVVANLSLKPSADFYISWINDRMAAVNFTKDLIPSSNYTLQIKNGVSSIYGTKLAEAFSLKFYTDGFRSVLPQINYFQETLSSEYVFPDTVNYFNLSNANSFSIKVQFTAYTNIDILSLYTKCKISYIFGENSLKVGEIDSILDLGAKAYLIVISSVAKYNYYKLSFTGGVGGIDDLLENHLDKTYTLYFYATN